MLLPEIAAAGIYDSRIAAKNIKISKKRKTSMFEIDLPMEDGGISYIDANAKQIIPNMIICAKPGQIRHTKFPFRCYYVHMSIHSGLLYDVLVNLPDYFETEHAAIYKEIFEKMVKHRNTLAEREEIILQSLLLELIYTISKDVSLNIKNGSRSGNGPVIEKALDYVSQHLTEELTLEMVADAVSISPVYFHKIFKASVGKTLRDYIEEQRIKKAIDLLLTTNDSLTQITFKCGFSSQSYFSFVFKRRMKKTPRQYAKEIHSRYEI